MTFSMMTTYLGMSMRQSIKNVKFRKFVAATNEATPGEITVLIYADAYEEESQSTLAYIGDGDIFSLTFTVKEDAEPGITALPFRTTSWPTTRTTKAGLSLLP